MIMSAMSSINLATLLASIPSPSTGSIHIGPLELRAYGMLMALGVIAGIWLAGKLMVYNGFGTTDQAASIGIWGAVGGVIGARLYHVATEWSRFSGNLSSIPKVWEGGLGIPGGLLLGVLFGVWRARQLGVSVPKMFTAAAPAIALGQAIARWGNYFNQELYGKPTKLPWGLQIDSAHLTPEALSYPPGTLFQPTFLYESLWNLGLCILLLLIHFRVRLAPGRLFGVYLVGYGIGRFWIESLRIDPAPVVAGLRWNQWVALAAFAGGAIYLFVTRGQRWPADDWQPQFAHADHGSTDSDEHDTDEHDTDRRGTDDADTSDEADADDADSDATGATARPSSRRTTANRRKKASTARDDVDDDTDDDGNDNDNDNDSADHDDVEESPAATAKGRSKAKAKASAFYDQTNDDVDEVDVDEQVEVVTDVADDEDADADNRRTKTKRSTGASKASSKSRSSKGGRRAVDHDDSDADHDDHDPDAASDAESDKTSATSRPKTDRPRRQLRGR